MNNKFLTGFVIFLGLVALAGYSSAFIVNQATMAVVLEFGKAKKSIHEPGLYWKIPIAQTVVYFDKRLIDVDTAVAREITAADQKRLRVNAFARYKIVDPLRFFQLVGTVQNAATFLEPSLNSALRDVLGRANFIDVVRTKRDELMHDIANNMNATTANNLGIKVIDVRIKRADLPVENSQSIYNRMQTQRKQEAAEIRAEGNEKAQGIRASADREATVIKAEALRDAERLRGEGDAERNRIYAEAFSKDPDFFAFYRSMQAYEEGLKSGNTQFIISPNSEFFRYFANPAGPEQKGANK